MQTCIGVVLVVASVVVVVVAVVVEGCCTLVEVPPDPTVAVVSNAFELLVIMLLAAGAEIGTVLPAGDTVFSPVPWLRANFLRICANWFFSRVASDLHHLRTRLKIPRATCVCIFTNACPTFNTQHVTDSSCWWNSSICILEIFYLLKKSIQRWIYHLVSFFCCVDLRRRCNSLETLSRLRRYNFCSVCRFSRGIKVIGQSGSGSRRARISAAAFDDFRTPIIGPRFQIFYVDCRIVKHYKGMPLNEIYKKNLATFLKWDNRVASLERYFLQFPPFWMRWYLFKIEQSFYLSN